ncbi:GGDEF domain-containing protein [Parasalinivibrio latis]|uniref:GGDEF domain-containing protein n=1 Tax=Parasalinivibrio latis TaxID=2952610 RepID=UPI0030E2DA34
MAALFLFLDEAAQKASELPVIIETAPYYLFAMAALLSQLFNQNRTGMMAVLMIVAYTVIQERLQTPLSVGTTRLEYVLLGLLLPLNILYTLVYPDKRFVSRSGALFFALVAGQLFWSYLLIEEFPQGSLTWLWESYLDTVPQISPLPFLLVLLGVAATCIAALFQLSRNGSSDQSALVCLLACTFTLTFFDRAHVSSLTFLLAGVLLCINMISFSHELAFIDGLTGIPGRRALENEMRHLGRRYSLAMMDIDHFKKFNDTYGHKMGDDVLRLVAAVMQRCEGGAKVYRYGGEEFTILFKGKSAIQCESHLNELREDIAGYELAIRNHDERSKEGKAGADKRGTGDKSNTVKVTISIGLADQTHGNSPQDVMKQADQALYKAKENGRNRLELA